MADARPLTDREIGSLDNKRGKSMLERRLLVTLRAALQEVADLHGRISQRETETLTEPETVAAENAFAHREKVLVVIHGDGFVEAFAERWVDVKIVSLWPWQDLDDPTMTDLELKEIWQRLHYPVKSRDWCMPRMARLPGAAEIYLKYLQCRDKIERNTELYDRLKGEIAQLTKAEARA